MRRGSGKSGREANVGRGEETVIKIRLTPRSSMDAVSGIKDGVIRIKIAAPPVEGKANQTLIAFLSKALGVPKNRLEIISGEKSRDKKVRVKGMTWSEVQNALAPTL